MPTKDAPRTPGRILTSSIAAKYLSAAHFEADLNIQPAAFVSAADSLRRKIRACAARSFAAQHRTADSAASLKGGGDKSQAGLLSRQTTGRLRPDAARALS